MREVIQSSLTTSAPLSLLSRDNPSEIYRASSGTSGGCAYLNITNVGVGQVSLSRCVSPRNWFYPHEMFPDRGRNKKKQRLTRTRQPACSLPASKSSICSHVFSASEQIAVSFLKRVRRSRDADATRADSSCSLTGLPRITFFFLVSIISKKNNVF